MHSIHNQNIYPFLNSQKVFNMKFPVETKIIYTDKFECLMINYLIFIPTKDYPCHLSEFPLGNMYN